MKKTRLLGLLLVLTITASALFSCKDKGGAGDESSSGSYIERSEYTVTFESNGGSSVAPITVYRNTQLLDIPETTREDYVFTGWTYEGEEWEFGKGGEYVRSDMTLYANWAKLSTIFQCKEENGSITLTKLINKDDFSTLILPESFNGMPITKIGAEVFKGFTFDANDSLYRGLRSITFPETVVSVGESAFERCSSLSVTFKGKITELGESAFFEAGIMSQITLGEGLKTIPFRAFSSCPITNVIIPDSVESIGENAFELSVYLQTAVVPKGATVEDSAFRSCESLRTVFFRGNESEFANLSISGNNDPFKSANVYYYSDSTDVENDKFWNYGSSGSPSIIVSK